MTDAERIKVLRAALVVCGNLSADVRWIHDFDEAVAELQRRAGVAQQALKQTEELK